MLNLQNLVIGGSDFELVGVSYLVAVSTRISGGQERGCFVDHLPMVAYSAELSMSF